MTNSVINIAIAEDQEIVRKGIIEIINGFGEEYNVSVEAANGKELIEKIRQSDTLPNLVVMDISMPELDGYETIDYIRKKWPDMYVLVLTMHKHEFAIIKMFRSGANGYLLKNSSPKVLEAAIKSILDTGIYFSEIASGKLYNRIQRADILPALSERELQVLKLCHTDLTYKEIGEKMKISERSVAGYRTTLFEKLNVNSRAALVACGIQMGIIAVE